MDKEMLESQFKNVKSQILKSVDSSRKGSIDGAIVKLVGVINAHDDFVTTSSCSGRIILISKDRDCQKKGCQWLYITHNEVNEADFVESLQKEKVSGNLILKFEPFILHIQCRTINGAKLILNSALESGFRNSGMILGKHGKIMVAIRSTLNMEVPIAAMGKILVDEKYISFLISEANQKMVKNSELIRKFESTTSRILSF